MNSLNKILFSTENTKYSYDFILDKELPDIELITCVFGVILKGERIWLTKNHRGWEFPGGHIEIGESPTQGLRRELQEELGIDTNNYDQFGYKKITNFKKYINRDGGFYPYPNSYIVFYQGEQTSDKIYNFCKDTLDSRLCTHGEAQELLESDFDKALLNYIYKTNTK